MPSSKDYYSILGIDKNASPEDIKKAYRKLAREHHPDMVGSDGKQAAEERFKEINEAYQVLSDDQKRKMYDQYGSSAFGGGAGGGSNGNPFGQGFGGGQWGPFNYTYSSGSGGSSDFDPFDIFEDFFGFRGFSGRRQAQKGKNLYYELHIEFKEAVFGVEKDINIESGKVKVKIPAGVRNGTEIRFAGKGMSGHNNLPPGDLFLTIRLAMPKFFQQVGDVLVTVKDLNMAMAALGGSIEVDVVDLKSATGLGKEKLKIPSGTQHGTQFRLRGRGMPRVNSSGQGDLIVQTLVSIPKSLSRKQKKILEEYLSS